MLKILRSATHGSTENWVLHGFRKHVVRPWTVPNLGMADWTFEKWTGYNMGSSDLEFRLDPDPELAYSSSLGLDRVRTKDWT